MTQAIELTLDEAILQKWIGRTEEKEDNIEARPANFLKSTLNQDGQNYKVGDLLPTIWHWLYFLESPKLDQLGNDGHAALGNFLPPVALPKRMWAGARLNFHSPIVIGKNLVKRSTIKNVQRKSGRSGELCVVTINHCYYSGSELTVEEDHDIVYRSESSSKPGSLISAPTEANCSETITPSTSLLFRYSALTFNTHRIHYDLDYCKNVEGYPGLIVHAPLTATLMLKLTRRYVDGNMMAFSCKSLRFRAISPLFDNQPFTLHLKEQPENKTDGFELWATNPEGKLAMTATLLTEEA